MLTVHAPKAGPTKNRFSRGFQRMTAGSAMNVSVSIGRPSTICEMGMNKNV